MKEWPEVAKFIKMKNPPVPFQTIGELLADAGNREMSSDTFRKVQNKETRIELLIEHGFWKPAIEEMCDTKLYEDYEEQLIVKARQAGQTWVEGEYEREKERRSLR